MIGPAYLGDGVYATTDGYGVELRLGAHDRAVLIVLDPEVARELVRYALRAGVLTTGALRLAADMHEQAGENGGA